MAKAKNTAFFCKECGYESAKWFGQCPACKEWNTFVEEPATIPPPSTLSSSAIPVDVLSFSSKLTLFISTGTGADDAAALWLVPAIPLADLGLLTGSLVLVGGDPGIGKSTLLLQMCYKLSAAGKDVLYISGEESLKQIKLRADRIGKCSGTLKLLCETSLDNIEDILTIKIVIFSPFASCISMDVVSLTCETLPGAAATSSLYIVCIESIITISGLFLVRISSMLPRKDQLPDRECLNIWLIRSFILRVTDMLHTGY